MSKNARLYIGAELDRIVEYARKEYHISYAEVVGMLVIKAHLLTDEFYEEGGEDPESEESTE